MENWAKLLTALGALFGSVAWPVAVCVLVLIFRKELRHALGRLPLFLDRVRKMKIAGIEADLERIGDESKKASQDGTVTADQARAAAKIQSQAQDVGIDTLLQELDALCLEYDAIRRTMASGRGRTNAMTQVIAKMRALGPAVADKVDIYKGSGSPGSRLAAIAIMQMVPQRADVPWLLERFRENQPFLFYHAALALSNAANIVSGADRDHIEQVAREAFDIISSFPGHPDTGTIKVLRSLAGAYISAT